MSQSLAAFLPTWPPQPEAILWVAVAVVATGLGKSARPLRRAPATETLDPPSFLRDL